VPLPRAKVVKASRPSRPKASKWVRLEQRINALPAHWCHGEILNLPGWKTLRYKELDHDIVVMAELDTPCAGDCVCPAESGLNKSGFTDPYYVQDLPIRCKRVRVYYRLQRRFCKHCRKSAQQPATGADEKHRMTARLVKYVGRESFDLFRNFTDIADEIGRSEQTVRNIFTRRAAQLEDESKRLCDEGLYEPPEWLAIDEVYPNKDVEYCVVSAPLSHQVIGLLPVNREKELLRWLLQLPNRHLIKVVTIDMWGEYRKLVRRLMPQARIVVDRYHVHNLLNVALKGVLEVVRASMTDSERREHMRPEHLLLTSYRKLSTKEKEGKRGVKQPSNKEMADRWLADIPDIARAHQLKGEFSDILQLTDREEAEHLTDEWLRRVCDFVEYFRGKYRNAHPGIWPDPFGNVPHTITDWRDSILNYISCKSMFGTRPVGNSFAEHVNGRIKQAYRVGHHYSFEVLRLKCVYGGVMVRRRPPHPLDEPQLRVVPRRGSGGRRGRKVNPNSNLEILRRARVEADDTRGLRRRPEENPEWAGRFDLTYMEKVRQAAAEAQRAEETAPASTSEKDMRSAVVKRGRKRRIRYNPDQEKLF